ncbi:MAG: helix-turn-helix domain-containing protein [Methanosarcinales archaeon]
MNKGIARKLIVETYLKNRNFSETARLWKTSRNVVRKWVKRYFERDKDTFRDLSHAPKNSSSRTKEKIENAVLKMRKDTGFGRRRLAFYLYSEKGIKISEHTIRHILKRAGYKPR